MSKDFNQLLSLISGFQRTDPRAYEAFRQTILYLQDLDQQLNPILRSVNSVVVATAVSAPTGFAYNFLPTGVLFSWNIVSSAILYELRVGGTTWTNANFVLRTTSLSAVILPLLIGSYTYRLKSINSAGQESTDESILSVVVSGPSQVVPSAAIVDNNVLLTWPIAAAEFTIDYYEVTRNGSLFGIIRGNFTTIFESVAGSYTYGITPVDIAGNRGIENTVTATVTQPPDFILDDSFVSNLTGTRVNAYVIPGY